MLFFGQLSILCLLLNMLSGLVVCWFSGFAGNSVVSFFCVLVMRFALFN